VGKYFRAGQVRDENMIQRMRFEYYIRYATNTQSEYVILMDFVLQKLLEERASVLRYRYIASLVLCVI